MAAGTDDENAPGSATGSPRRDRIDAIDFARGAAITLMILSHGVKGLLDFEQFPDWGLVPVHLITKWSSSLFILVFGMALGVAYVPHVGDDSWPARRKRLLWRGLVILFWYKVLTVVEMLPRHPPEDVLDALLYRSFPVFVEILGFYGLALLWIPFVLPLWARLPLLVQALVPPALGVLAWWLAHAVTWDSDVLQALLVEHEDHYTWGQLSRAPLVFLGLILGRLALRWRDDGHGRLQPAAVFAGVSALFAAGFLALASGDLGAELEAIARNAGKHPPEPAFMLFSLGGAFLVLSLAFLGGRELARVARPITVVGTDALQAFIAHVVVLCLFYRYLLGYFRTVSYEKALVLTAILFGVTWLWIELVHAVRRWRRPARS